VEEEEEDSIKEIVEVEEAEGETISEEDDRSIFV
jgi:hypothetical protein